jgi:hypothetical protein
MFLLNLILKSKFWSAELPMFFVPRIYFENVYTSVGHFIITIFGWKELLSFINGGSETFVPLRSESLLTCLTSHSAHCVCTTKTSQLILLREIIAGDCEKRMEHLNALCGENAEFLNIIVDDSYSYTAL